MGAGLRINSSGAWFFVNHITIMVFDLPLFISQGLGLLCLKDLALGVLGRLSSMGQFFFFFKRVEGGAERERERLRILGRLHTQRGA